MKSFKAIMYYMIMLLILNPWVVLMFIDMVYVDNILISLPLAVVYFFVWSKVRMKYFRNIDQHCVDKFASY